MDQQAILHTDYLDIIFANRNKDYGSYELRTHYSKRLKLAFLTIITLGAAFCLFVITNAETPTLTTPNERVIELSDITPPDLPQPVQSTPAPPSAPMQEIEPATADVLKIVPDEQLPEDIQKPPAELSRTTEGEINTTGENIGLGTGPGVISGGGDHPGFETPEPPAESRTYEYVEEMPSLAGGVHEFLSRNLRYPSLARENSIEGRVVIEFIVDEKGQVTNAHVIRGIGGGCDEEALRVVNKMPRWNPGRMNNRAVRVVIRLPISFRLD